MLYKRVSYFLLGMFFSCQSTDNSLREENTVFVQEEQQRGPAADSVPALPVSAVIEKPSPFKWAFDKVAGTKLLFKEGRVFDTKLFDLAYIGQIAVEGKAPFLIYAGRECKECDANVSIYFHSSDNGQPSRKDGGGKYLYPGKERDYMTDSLVYEASAFYGEIRKGIYGIAWFQRMLLEDNSFKSTVFIAKLVGGKIVEEEAENFEERLGEILSLNKAGKNTEIKGREYTSEP